jgi:hypothetical protein
MITARCHLDMTMNIHRVLKSRTTFKIPRQVTGRLSLFLHRQRLVFHV